MAKDGAPLGGGKGKRWWKRKGIAGGNRKDREYEGGKKKKAFDEENRMLAIRISEKKTWFARKKITFSGGTKNQRPGPWDI